MWFLYTALVGAVIIALLMLWSRARRAFASSRRAATLQDNPAPHLATESDLALRYAGSPFDHVGMRQVHDLQRQVRQGVPVTSFTFRFLADNNAAMADLSWRSYDVITVRLPARLPTLKVTTKPMFHTPKHDGPLTRVVTGDPQFDEYYAAYTDNPMFANEALGEQLRTWITQAEAQSWLVQGDEILAWNRHYDDTDLDTIPQFLLSVVRRMPDVIWQRVGLDPRIVSPQPPGPYRPGEPNGLARWDRM